MVLKLRGLLTLQCTCLYPNMFFLCVKGTRFRSPLHQHLEIKVHQTCNEIIHFIFKVNGLRGDYQNSSHIVPFYPMQTMQGPVAQKLKIKRKSQKSNASQKNQT